MAEEFSGFEHHDVSISRHWGRDYASMQIATFPLTPHMLQGTF
jgi:hypothetical protein